MKIGVPIEIKNSENRVGMIPSGVFELTKRNHEVYVQTNAGFNSGFLDEEYIEAGATILDSIEAVYEIADMIVKVKEPIEPEYDLIREDQVVFTYFHFASSEPLTRAMIKSKSVCIAYETVEDNDGSLPLLIPMSEVAGRMSVQQGAKFLEKPIKGRGILLGGIPGVPPAKVLILGAGIVGYQAAKMASGLGAQVTIMDINMKALRYVSDSMPNNVISEFSSEYNIRKHIVDADLIIGGVLLKGAKAPKLITRDMLKEMRPGTVMVDVAVDQGGCFETTHPTTHQDPTYIIDEVVHYTVANMPGAVPYTSTMGLTNVTLPYVIKLANEGWEQACQNSAPLARGLNIIKGKIVYKEIAEAFDMSLETA
ncbi:alanine dehydrogenase [Algibacter lectus]|uniref:Alanine dehydrogenase n=1 Tax=Algibacter lectus TaxID=221126 RepID=A0A090WRK0_9FLAO|nr:alanine dehydrogenase [Algibacter lectus]MWW24689.1 alanine dehydrogenase [Algibacter lectus]TDY62710.1 alanine dehydrogenase [Algibacter lectus]SFC92883.1 alanine dehydrogenase [Algibacter lectus]GAL62852.1 alanine dehydrogenase [Algibacter lectus]GAL79651.1 alanine dehydrogenase [Algibacter lectus]